jgi:formylmethanofuran dehydrogenase subunit A
LTAIAMVTPWWMAAAVVYAVRIDEWAGCVTDAVQRGELPEGTDPHAVIAVVSAPLYYALLNTGRPLTDEDADRAARAAIAAARAGTWTQLPPEGSAF